MSSKTPTEPPSATASEHRKNPVHLILGVLLLSFGFAALWSGVRSATDNKQQLFTPSTRLLVEIVESDDDRRLGLSEREALDEKNGMLFVFNEASENNCFWMKDMNFAIDMIWLDEQKNVVTVVQDISPETYPESFCPEAAAKYGLEITAGTAEEFEIKKGEKLRF